MAPTYIKGGVWTNVEDEILRAAISKYGLNQWARVSSLLARKTAKQVKARWFEWLDPTIKKIEWSREEDEKLLHLAKLMPTQWRTIAPIVGRTATQCIERYQKLLDEAEQDEQQQSGEGLSLTGVGGDASAPVGARKYRAGDIDPTPESKPARPDAVDMDADELEMLSEARARLANTQGKKAKRKDRERILEESKRLALLQKRRELKLAGINAKLTKKRKNQVDYNADIPFEHKPAPGFYDTSDEIAQNLRSKAKFDLKTHHKGVLMKESLDKDRNDKKRTRDPEAIAAAAEQSAQAKAERLLELNQSDKISKRRKLVLPAPQVNEEELEQIVKYGTRGDRAREKYNDADSVTGTLMTEYSESVIREPTRTPQVNRSDDRILQSVRDIHALANEQSSLLGDVNTPLHDSTFSSGIILPNHEIVQTPNALKTISQTPRRDGLGVNKADIAATPREVLRRGFESLPKPLNNFDIVMPEDDELRPATATDNELEEDAGERARLLKIQEEEERQRELKRRSQVLQRGLPRPIMEADEYEFAEFKAEKSSEINSEVASELSRLIISDNVQYPADGYPIPGDIVPSLADEDRKLALAEIEKELNKDTLTTVVEKFGAQVEAQPYVLPGLDYESDTEEDADVAERLVEGLTELGEKCNKLEHKLSLTMGGYMKRQALLTKKYKEAFDAATELRKERLLHEDMKAMEAIGISSRLNQLQEEVNFLADAERRGQERYRDLTL